MFSVLQRSCHICYRSIVRRGYSHRAGGSFVCQTIKPSVRRHDPGAPRTSGHCLLQAEIFQLEEPRNGISKLLACFHPRTFVVLTYNAPESVRIRYLASFALALHDIILPQPPSQPLPGAHSRGQTSSVRQPGTAHPVGAPVRRSVSSLVQPQMLDSRQGSLLFEVW